MGYVRTAEEVEAYDVFYTKVNSNVHAVGAAFTTTEEFARSVVPPCFEVPSPPTGSFYGCTNCEEIDGERTGEDEEAGVVAIDVLYEGRPGSYSLSVFVTRDQSLATGREAWSMPKKLGEVHLMGNGLKSTVIVQRKGAEMRLETTLKAPEFVTSPEPTTSTFYELKTGLNAAGGLQHAPVLIEFEVTQRTYMHQEGEVDKTQLFLKGTDDDPLHTVPVREITSAYSAGFIMNTKVRRQVELGTDVDYRPYMYGRFYDDWPRTAAKAKKARSAQKSN
ncbi:acetoacetate decarboxylase [Fusarium acuminatum]|uniref:Acetoacetate decarboxylase n=1 Tax=Fusarium acuminatum TaxID=5515 RepID=A0ABZ2XB87_9HYPO